MKRRGFTLVELMVVIAIIALLVGLLLPALSKAIRASRSLRDATQINQIHTTFVTFANGAKGKFPTPGLINRLFDPYTQSEQPGLGPEDFSKNHTAPMYSAMIAQRYFAPEILIGPTEVNPNVVEMTDYDYDAYDPGADTYWDGDFQARIERPAGSGTPCHTSYAHTAICGDRKQTDWRDDNDASVVNIGTRGVGTGFGTDVVDVSDDAYKFSPTLELHGPRKQWNGNLTFNDGHSVSVESMYPLGVSYEPADGGLPHRDHVFAAEFEDQADPQLDGRASGDAWLVISFLADDEGASVSAKWDRLTNQ